MRPGIRPGFRSMSLTDAPTRRWPESQFRSLSVAQLPVGSRVALALGPILNHDLAPNGTRTPVWSRASQRAS